MTTTQHTTHFAPELHIPNGTFNIDFYTKFGAIEHFCFRNNDGSIHVVELEINGAIFHLHETMRDALEPISAKGVTSIIGLFVPNVDEVMQKAIQAGATEINPAEDLITVTDKECSKTLLGIIGKYRKKYKRTDTITLQVITPKPTIRVFRQNEQVVLR